MKFTVNTQLVVETVSVKDKNGKPIEGLTAKDFVVTEDGVPQTISFCEFQKMQDAPRRAAPGRRARAQRRAGRPGRAGHARADRARAARRCPLPATGACWRCTSI